MVNELGFKIRKNTVQSVWMMWEKAFALLSHFRGSHKSRFGICTVMLKSTGDSLLYAKTPRSSIRESGWENSTSTMKESWSWSVRRIGSCRTANGSHAAQINAPNQWSLRIAVRVQAGQGFIGDYTAPSGINTRSWFWTTKYKVRRFRTHHHHLSSIAAVCHASGRETKNQSANRATGPDVTDPFTRLTEKSILTRTELLWIGLRLVIRRCNHTYIW